MDFPVSWGAWQPRREPDAPTALLMIGMPCPLFGEGSPPDLFRQGRAEVLGMGLQDYEQQVREQLSGMYARNGFDTAWDIATLTIHRWPHSYAWGEASIDRQPAHEIARARHGQIDFANVDSAGKAHTQDAIDMAWRAVVDLST